MNKHIGFRRDTTPRSTVSLLFERLACQTVVASGLMFVAIGTAAASPIPDKLDQELRNKGLCWKLERAVQTDLFSGNNSLHNYSWTSSSWIPSPSLASGSDVKGHLRSVDFEFNENSGEIYFHEFSGADKLHPVEYFRYRAVPCAAPKEEATTLQEDNGPGLPAGVDIPHEFGSPAPLVPLAPPAAYAGIYAGTGIDFGHITITSPTDKDKFKYDSPTFQVGGEFNYGSWFASGQVTVPILPRGTVTESFGGVSSSTSDIETGLPGIVQIIAGHNLFQTPTTRVRLFAQFYEAFESLNGALPGNLTEMPLLTDRWVAGGGGVKVDQQFNWGGRPFDFSASAAGLFDNVRSGPFNGNGGGFQASAGLYTPLGPGQIGVSAQYTDLNASGSSMGVPLRQGDQNLLIAISLQRNITP